MSNSDSEDDDELFLTNAPIFGRRSTRLAAKTSQKSKANQMMDFLDECVAEEEERAINQSKIRSMMMESAAREVANLSPDPNQADGKENVARTGNNEDLFHRVQEEIQKNTNNAIAARRRKMDDAVEGILASPNACQNVSCFVSDVDYLEQRARKIASVNAMATAASSNLGCRHVFARSQSPSHDLDTSSSNTKSSRMFSPFSSQKDAFEDLKLILNQIQGSSGEDAKSIRRLVDSIRKAVDTDMLLHHMNFTAIAINSEKLKIPVPTDLQRWIWRIACTPSEYVGTELADGGAKTLCKILSFENDSKAATVEKYLSPLQFIDMLTISYGLKLKHNKEADKLGIVDIKRSEETIRDQYSGLEGELNPPIIKVISPTTLKRAFDLWTLAFQKDQILKETTCFHEMQRTTTLVLEACVKASLDPIFPSGVLLLESVRQLMTAAITYTKKQLEFTCNKSEQTLMFREWLATTASGILHQVSALGPGIEGAGDCDDTEGYLPIPRALRSFPVLSSDRAMKIICAQLKALFAQDALRTLLDCSSENWTSRKLDLLLKWKQASSSNELDINSVRWNAFAAGELCLKMIDEQRDGIIQNGSLFYAIVQVVELCTFAAATLCQLSERDERKAVCACLEDMELLCIALRKKVTSVFMNPHLRRVKELLVNLSGHFRHERMIINDQTSLQLDTPERRTFHRSDSSHLEHQEDNYEN